MKAKMEVKQKRIKRDEYVAAIILKYLHDQSGYTNLQEVYHNKLSRIAELSEQIDDIKEFSVAKRKKLAKVEIQKKITEAAEFLKSVPENAEAILAGLIPLIDGNPIPDTINKIGHDCLAFGPYLRILLNKIKLVKMQYKKYSDMLASKDFDLIYMNDYIEACKDEICLLKRSVETMDANMSSIVDDINICNNYFKALAESEDELPDMAG